MLAMFPTVMVVLVTPVAVAPPFPPAGAWFPLAPHGALEVLAAGDAPDVDFPDTTPAGPEDPLDGSVTVVPGVPPDALATVVVVVFEEAADD
jgi:hypothetical protein